MTECLQNESDDGHDRFHEAELQCCLTQTIIHVNNPLTSQNIENTCIKIDAHLLAKAEKSDCVGTSGQAASTAPEACSKKKREKENERGR